MPERVMLRTVWSEDGGTTTTTTPFLPSGRITESVREKFGGSKDSVSGDDGEVSILTGFMEFLDRLERGDEVWSESICPLPVLFECNNLPRLAGGRPEDTCVTFEICHVLLITKELRER